MSSIVLFYPLCVIHSQFNFQMGDQIFLGEFDSSIISCHFYVHITNMTFVDFVEIVTL
jgi:hypothetical protein